MADPPRESMADYISRFMGSQPVPKKGYAAAKKTFEKSKRKRK